MLPAKLIVTIPLAVCAVFAASGTTVVESARGIPVAANVDVVIAGGSITAVSAALEAARAGRSVLVIAPRPHLGDELADTFRMWLEPGERATGALGEKIFSAGNPANPVRLKKTLEDALSKAGVKFFYSSYATEVLKDAAGRPAGIVIMNRAGRQAVIAKVVIDATPDGTIAVQAGAVRRPWPAGAIEFKRVVLADQEQKGNGYVRTIQTLDKNSRYDEYALKIDAGNGSYAAQMAAEQTIRDRTYVQGQLRGAGRASFLAPNPIIGRTGTALDHYRPRGVDYLWVASQLADIPRDEAAKMERPQGAETAGRLIGAAAAAEAEKRPAPRDVRLRAASAVRVGGGDVKEVLGGLRSNANDGGTMVRADARPLPVLGSYDVVIIGGGTAGGAAAIAATRQKAKVLVIEYQDALGGTGTVGLIGTPYHGRDVGYAHEVPWRSKTFTYEDKMEWYRQEIRKNGGDIWFRVLGAGAWVEGQTVKGAVVATPEQRGVVLAKVVIDATGNSDIAIAAGAAFMYGANANDIAIQGSGYPSWAPAANGNNTDYVMVDESDMVDVWQTLVGARMTMEDSAFDSGTMLQTRERRRIIGDFVLSYIDQIAGRRYADSVVLGDAPYDDHGYPSDDIFALFPHDEKSKKQEFSAPGGMAYTPYRCLLPRGLDGILVSGLGISIERDAAEIVRMQRDIGNQGYAAGYAALLAVRGNVPPRQIDVRTLQKHLVEIGNLPPDVLEHHDSFPRPAAEIAAAVRRLPLPAAREEIGRRLGLILSHRAVALPMLRTAHNEAEGENRLVYARVLGMLGEKEVVPELVKALDEIQIWDVRILQGKMAEYSYQPAPVDTLMLALGRTRDQSAVPALLRKLETLDAAVWLSHHRAIAAALESIGDPAAAAPLAKLLAKPGMSGYAVNQVVPIHKAENRRQRIEPLREISLARALYRCGDQDGMGERILRQYKDDLRGVFARHASEVLKAPQGKR